MSDRLKQLLKYIQSYSKWIIAILVIVLVVWGIRSCSRSSHKKHTIYTIGRVSSWYPLQLYGRERKLVAFTNELVANISTESGLRFQWVETNPQTLLDGLQKGSYDFILTTLTPTTFNENHYNFSNRIFQLGAVLVVRKDSQITSLAEMDGLPIGMTSGFSSRFNAINKAGSGGPDLLILTYDTIYRALDALVNDQIDGVVTSAMEAYSATQGLYARKLKVVTPPLDDEGIRFASLTSSSLEDIINDIDDALESMKEDGTYAKLISKWELVDPETAFWRPPSQN